MSTISNLLGVSLVTASLLLAGTSRAGDASSDCAQANAAATPASAGDPRSPGGAQPAEAKTCHCAVAVPRSAPERSMLDDPDFTGYQPG